MKLFKAVNLHASDTRPVASEAITTEDPVLEAAVCCSQTLRHSGGQIRGLEASSGTTRER